MELRQNIRYRDADKILRANGFKKYSCKGSHFKYKNGTRSVIIPKDLNPVIWNRICKEHNLKGE